MTQITTNTRVIRVHPSDNVAIVVEQGGLAEGTVIEGSITTTMPIPQGHKVALEDIAEGAQSRERDECSPSHGTGAG